MQVATMAATTVANKKPSGGGWSSVKAVSATSKDEADPIPKAKTSKPRVRRSEPPRRCKSSEGLGLDDGLDAKSEHNTRIRRSGGPKKPAKARSFNAAMGDWSTQKFGDEVKGPGMKRIGKKVEPIEKWAHMANGEKVDGTETATSIKPEAFHGISRKAAVNGSSRVETV